MIRPGHPSHRSLTRRPSLGVVRLRRTAFVVTAFFVGNALAVALAPSPASRGHAARGNDGTHGRHTAIPAYANDPAREPIYGRNLFGVERNPTRTTPPVLVDSGNAAARYELIGTVVGSDPLESQAILRAKRADAEAFLVRPRQILDGGVEILAIERRRLIVAVDGVVESLPFELDSPVEAGTTLPPQVEHGSPTAASELPDDVISIDASTFERVARDPTPLASEAHWSPALVEGRLAGWRVAGIRRGSPFEQLGLRNGDVVEGIDAVPLNSIQAALTSLDRLRTSRDFEVQLLRDDRHQTLAYRVHGS